ncbi:MAG TPA: universal stress protein [Thermoplasmata archaeon]|nr:universal stress protein [Thermoplasmata archaeon]
MPERSEARGEVGAPRRILVGYDGSRAAARATEWAVALARTTGAALWLVHGSAAPTAVAEPQTDEEQGKEVHALDDALEGVRRRAAGLGLAVTVLNREGPAARVLIDAANEVSADLIVVGTRGLRSAARVFLGSVSTAVVAESGRPVLVVP